MEDLTLAVCILGSLLVIVIDAILANYFYDVACEKGYTERRYFWVPFLFGLIGYLLVVALPDRGKTEQPSKSTAAAPVYAQRPKPVVTKSSNGVGRWVCPDCGNIVPGDVIRCKCGYER